MEYAIKIKNRSAWVNVNGVDKLLFIRDEDVSCPTKPGKDMHRALYDLFQVEDGLKSGDTFSFRGKPVYRCAGVHVEPI